MDPSRPAPATSNYYLEIGCHPFDDDGIGFVYDFVDTDNYARVLFVSQPSATTRIPAGLTVSRKKNGAWSDIVLGDNTFLFTSGRPFALTFANPGGACRLTAREIDNPSALYEWAWLDQAPSAGNRFGLATWQQTDAHFLYANAQTLPASAGPTPDVSLSASIQGGNIVITISNPSGAPYDVESSRSLAPAAWTTAASNQTGNTWTSPLPSGPQPAFWRLRLRQ